MRIWKGGGDDGRNSTDLNFIRIKLKNALGGVNAEPLKRLSVTKHPGLCDVELCSTTHIHSAGT
jgi:hypothetical protein